MNRPTALTMRLANIPDALKVERRWVVWRFESRDDRWAKILCRPDSASSKHVVHAKPNDHTTWTTFADAAEAFGTGRFDGLGFCLGNGVWSGVDLDHCRTTAGAVNDDARSTLAQLDRLGAYVEVSPSGTGFKAIGRASCIGGQIDFRVTPPAITKWHGARFFAVTGHGSGDPMADLSTVIDELFPSVTAPRGAVPSFIRPGDTRGTEAIERFTDDQVVERVLASPQADKFIRLVRGDVSEYGDDHSRADQAFVSILAYWCQGDLDQVDRLFRQSGLMRAKWDTASYRRATLAKAVTR